MGIIRQALGWIGGRTSPDMQHFSPDEARRHVLNEVLGGGSLTPEAKAQLWETLEEIDESGAGSWFRDEQGQWRPASAGPRHQSGNCVYLIRNEAGYVKIGRTTNLKERLHNLRVGSPERLEVVHVIYSENHAGVERRLHSRYASKRRLGEWFDLSAEDIQQIKTEFVE